MIDGVTVRPTGLITAVAVFVIANALFTPFIFKMARKYAPAAMGGIGLISTLVALLIASALGDALTISGFMPWVLATMLVWVITALGGWAVMAWWMKKRVQARRDAE
ncbi:MAG: phage holin family protein [Tessaracoccus sp.]|uniref:phage holin family protein n=1 Tax=Tessaracoccus sp. TaxID=1971211 RepID=UPI001ECC1A85|nr:phage holin family protein [Tessaracoccus sp.]MBK7821985.1 phage holin family protein [Tessaracoccus sp.]